MIRKIHLEFDADLWIGYPMGLSMASALLKADQINAFRRVLSGKEG